jgi:NAD-dependent SIR2 family protein deacetylase
MGGYASGKYSIAICDRCGQQYKYLELKKEWTGFKVCPECYEPKHPQLLPKRTLNEPQAIYQPRPQGPTEVVGMQPTALTPPLVGLFALGTVTVVIT